ncbi:hypothetical protein BaRGS_00016602, partial [Batillaria attramentaria]
AIRTGLFDNGTFRYVECFITVRRNGYLRLTLNEIWNENKTLMSWYQQGRCINYSRLSSCSTSSNPKSTSATVKAVIDDLPEGETRTYGCDATYSGKGGLKTETYTISVTRVQSSSVSTTEENLPVTSTQNGAPQLVKSGFGTKDNPIIVRGDTDVTFYLRADPAPFLSSAAYLGKTMLHHNSSQIHQAPEMIRCWPLRFRDLVQCEVDADLVDEGFYSVTLVNKEGGITVFLQVEPKQSETWRATYANVQRSPDQEMVTYRPLGEAVVRDVGVNVEERERFYHEVDDSHLGPEPGKYSALKEARMESFDSSIFDDVAAALSAVNLRGKSRHCRAPPASRLHAPLPPLPSDPTVTSLRRCSSLPDDYLHPAASRLDRREADNAAASRIHRRCSLPSDYLHPVDMILFRQQSPSMDC